MYTAYIDGLPLHDPNNGFLVANPNFTQELNKVGSFSFTIYPNHPYFDFIEKLKSIVTVYDRDMMVFRGRVLNDTEGFYNEKQIECESDLAFLLDSVVRPYDYQGDLKTMFAQLLESHNEQVDEARKFMLGNVTVTDTNDYIHYSSTVYPRTWDEINNKLVKTHGGYLFVRHEEDGNYLDYLDDFELLSRQTIEFGKNLLDYARKTKGEDIATAIIPLGKRDEELDLRLTIEDVNDGLDYVFDAAAVEKYGYIFETVEFDDVTVAANLKRKGEEYLAEKVQVSGELTLTAVDLAALNVEFGSFHLGTYVKCVSDPHGLNANFLVSKLDISLSDPTANKLSLGNTYSSMTEQSTETKKEYEDLKNNINGIVTDVTDARLESEVSSQISQATDQIYTEVGEKYYLKDDAEKLVSDINTQFSQTKDEFTFEFNNFQQSIQDVVNGQDAKFSDITKYIRFIDGDIVLGVEGNALTLKIQHDKISFYENNLEVAYFSNNKLYVTDATVTNRFDMGLFGWFPRKNGNLTLRYFGDGETINGGN